MFAAASRQQTPAGFKTGAANALSGLVFDRQLPPSQHAWSSSAGQALEQLKKTADNLLRAQQTSKETTDVTEQELQQAKQEVHALKKSCKSEQQRSAELLASKREAEAKLLENSLHYQRYREQHESLQLDVTQLTAFLDRNESACTSFKAALHACEDTFRSKVEAFERQAERFENLTAEMQASAESEMQLFKQECERQGIEAQQQLQQDFNNERSVFAQLATASESFAEESKENIASLTRKIDEQAVSMHSLDAQLSTRADQIQADATSLHDLRQQLKTLEKESEELHHVNGDLSRQVQISMSDQTTLQRNLVSLKESNIKQMSTLEAQIMEQEHAIHELENAKASMQEAAERHQTTLKDTTAQLAALQHQLAISKDTFGQLTSKLADSDAAASSAIARLEMYAAKTQQEFARVKADHARELKAETLKVTEANDQLRDISAQLTKAKSEIAPLESKASDLQNTVDQQALQHKSKDSELQTQVKDLQTQLLKDKQDHHAELQRANELQQRDSSTMAEQQSKLSSLSSQLADQATAIKDAGAREQQLSKEHAAETALLQRQLVECESLQRIILQESQQKDVIAKQQAADAAAKQQLSDEKLSAEQKASSTALAAVKQTMEDTLAQKDDEMQLCSTELVMVKKQLYHAGGRIDSLSAMIEEAQRHAADAQQAFETQTNELANKTLLLQQISHHAAQPGSDPTPRRSPNAQQAHKRRRAASPPYYPAAEKAYLHRAEATVETEAVVSSDEEPARHTKKASKSYPSADKHMRASKKPSSQAAKPGASVVTVSRKRGSIFTSMSAHNSGQNESSGEEDSPLSQPQKMSQALSSRFTRKGHVPKGRDVAQFKHTRGHGYHAHAASIGEMFAGLGT